VFGVYSPRPAQVRAPAPIDPPRTLAVVAAHDGPAEVAAYSVIHDRDGAPARALLVCDLPGGARTYATVADLDLCTRAEHEELVGATVLLAADAVDGPLGPGTVNRAVAQPRS